MSYSEIYIYESAQILLKMDICVIEDMVGVLYDIKTSNGRIFFIGVGGNAANCSHAVNDFRKILGIEAYAPTDNVSELTARTNDDGWSTVFVEWLKTSHLNKNDCVFVLSVGGGIEDNISQNIVKALMFAKNVGCKILGIVGGDGGYTKRVADVCCLIPVINEKNITPHTEGFQAIVWHLLASHPRLKNKTKRAVFLDRDGVINEKITKDSKIVSPSCLEEVHVCEGVHESIRILNGIGLSLAVVTNQPDVARGIRTKEDVTLINHLLGTQFVTMTIKIIVSVESQNQD
jgi:D-sedoheptulose 7-phosphate isomerase